MQGAQVRILVRGRDPMCCNSEFTCHREDGRSYVLQLRPAEPNKVLVFKSLKNKKIVLAPLDSGALRPKQPETSHQNQLGRPSQWEARDWVTWQALQEPLSLTALGCQLHHASSTDALRVRLPPAFLAATGRRAASRAGELCA